VADTDARSQVLSSWNVSEMPSQPGRDTAGIIAAAGDGSLGALLVGGVEVADLPDPDAARRALDTAPFVVSLELRHSEVTERADVVLPVAPVVEKAGSFLNWEGRQRQFSVALRDTGALPDLRVLDAIADEMGVDLGLPTAEAARAELLALTAWNGTRSAEPSVAGGVLAQPESGEAILSSWRQLLDLGKLQDGEPYLAGTARTPVVRLSASTAAQIGAAEGVPVAVSTDRGSITLPLAITDMPDRVVWLPLNSPGSQVYEQLGAAPGTVVSIEVGP
jgi:NADH-quinone oxidoreductase subunit G